MKPAHLVYGLDDKPPTLITAFLGLQHVSIIAIAFVFPVLLMRESGGTTDQAAFLISMSMMAGGVGVIAQALKKGPMGSGYLCPQVCGPSFLTASILCVKTGGLPLVFGMTAFAGAFEALFSRVVHRLRVLFPTEVTGLIVAMVGITVIRLAAKNFLGLDPQTGAIDPASLTVGAFTLAVMVGLNVWTRGNVRLFCILLGMVAGYGFALAMGELTLAEVGGAMARPLVWFPFAHHPGWAFDSAMILPMAIAVLCSSLKSIGDLTTCQKINDTAWKRPDLRNMQKGILADAAGCFAAGVLGGYGQSTSSTNIGLTIATGTTSRIIAWSTGLVLIALAFCPKLTGIFAVMPRPVVGATLVFALGFMVVAGMQIVMSRMLDGRKTFIIGLSMIFGLSVDLLPEAFTGFHPWLAAIFSSSLSTATVSAVLLNLLFRIGVKSSATIRVRPGAKYGEAITRFLHRQGGAWAARREVVDKAAAAASEYMEALGGPSAPHGEVTVRAEFDEYNLDVCMIHENEAPDFPEAPPAPEELLEEGGTCRQAGFLVQYWADKISVKRAGGLVTARLHFEH